MKTNNLINTFRQEEKYTTSVPNEMLNKFLAKRIVRKWEEDFADEDTGEVVSIDRYEVIMERGEYLDQENLMTLNFHMSAGDITEVEVSNQRRAGFEGVKNKTSVWKIKCVYNGKSFSFVLYANSIDNARCIFNDFAEQMFKSEYYIMSIASIGDVILLEDNLRSLDHVENKDVEQTKKFYDVDIVVKVEGLNPMTVRYFVNSYNSDKAIFAIKLDIEKRKTEGVNYETLVEKINPMPSLIYIPREFTEEYNGNEIV